MKSLSVLILLAVLVVVMPASPVLADGCFIPIPAVEAQPTIPTQTALITWRDGIETLVVESRFQTDSPSAAWIVPLPAEPVSIERGEPGMLDALPHGMGPRIVNALGLPLLAGGMILFCISCVVYIIISENNSALRRRGFFEVAILAVLGLFFVSMMMPALGGAGLVRNASSLRVERQEHVGNYEIFILRAEKTADLSEWLAANSLKTLESLPPAAAKAVGDYIAEGWCFMVARLDVGEAEGRLATPHPLSVRFPSERIIYPMRLTALAESTTRVRLFVVADKPVAAEGFAHVAGGCFRLPDDRQRDGRFEPYYESYDNRFLVGSPDVCGLLWDNCEITALMADLTPADMSRDVLLTKLDRYPSRMIRFSREGRRDLLIFVAQIAAGIVLIYVAFIFRCRRKASPGQLKALFALLFLGTAACAIAYLAAPVIDVEPGLRAYFALQSQRLAASVLLHEEKLSSDATLAQLRAYPDLAERELSERDAQNPYTGRRMTHQRSPGDYFVREIDGRAVLCLYDYYGRETRLDLAEMSR